MKQNILKKLSEKIGKIFSPSAPKGRSAKDYRKQQNIIEHEFTLAGKKFFRFVAFESMPVLRALKTALFYEEYKSKTPDRLLKLHCLAIKELLEGSEQIDIFKVHKLNQSLLERLNNPLDILLLYKLASIIYFDETEDVTTYDEAHNLKKIEFWKKHSAFDILSLPSIQEYLPILRNAGDLKQFEQVAETMNDMQLDLIMKSLPTKEVEKLKGKSFFESVVLPMN